MGYRLPLESLPWTKPEDVAYSFDPDPFAHATLANRPARRPQLFTAPPRHYPPRGRRTARSRRKKASPRHGCHVPPSALQSRDGMLFVFLPPVQFVADYLDLVAAIEDTAAYLRMPVARGLHASLRSAHLRD